METPLVRHLFVVYWQKVAVFFLISYVATGQARIQYQADYENQPVHYGFFFGAGPKTYIVRPNVLFMNDNSARITSITAVPSTQMRIGGQINASLTNRLDFRMLPGIAITTEKLFHIARSGPTNEIYKDRQDGKAWLELPVHLKLKSQRRGNTRMYMFGGFRGGYETNALDKLFNATQTAQSIATKRTDFCVEYGFGLDAFLRYFKFSPEVIFSHGVANSKYPFLNADSTPVPSQLVDKLYSNSVTLQFIFN